MAGDPGRSGKSAIGRQRERPILKLVLIAAAVTDGKPCTIGNVVVALEIIGIGIVTIGGREKVVVDDLIIPWCRVKREQRGKQGIPAITWNQISRERLTGHVR